MKQQTVDTIAITVAIGAIFLAIPVVVALFGNYMFWVFKVLR